MPEPDVPLYEGPEKQGDPAALDAWLAETGEMVVATLREAGPEAPVWSWGWERSAGFWARRMAHEIRSSTAPTRRSPPGGRTRWRRRSPPTRSTSGWRSWSSSQRTMPHDEAARTARPGAQHPSARHGHRRRTERRVARRADRGRRRLAARPREGDGGAARARSPRSCSPSTADCRWTVGGWRSWASGSCWSSGWSGRRSGERGAIPRGRDETEPAASPGRAWGPYPSVRGTGHSRVERVSVWQAPRRRMP